MQFRKWATRGVEELIIKGFAMDDERLARGGSALGDRYFEEQLQRDLHTWTDAPQGKIEDWETRLPGEGAAKGTPRTAKP